MADRERDHDITVYGASGYVGALVAAYLAEHLPDGARVALAGRSRERVARVRAGLPGRGRDWPVVLADSDDAASLDALALRTRVLVTTVGPYARHGLPVVEACARAGTHYADLAGEVLFVRAAIDRTDALARAGGARLVHSCGYDSVPSDLATWLLARRAAADGAGALRAVRLVATARGGVSGGTFASARGQAEAVLRDRAARRLVADPFALSPDRPAEPGTPQPPDLARPARQTDGRWTTAFPLARHNTRVVRRSNALQRWAYGRSLSYGEVLGCGRGPSGAAAATGVTAGLAALAAGMSLPPTRALLGRLLPGPGSGPSERTRREGWFRMEVEAVTETGRRYRALAAGTGDPGYAATAVMLGEAATSLAFDVLPERAGSLTPATAFGDVLVERLRAAGHRYHVEECSKT